MSDRDVALSAEYFAKHEAAYSHAEVGGAVIERLVWAQPGTSINRVEYVCVNGSQLIVTRDLGDAIYNAGAADLSWWAQCDLDYFAGKCLASENGPGYRTWDCEAARARLREEVERMREDGEDVDDNLVSDAEAALISGGYEWQRWMAEEASDLFGDDWWEFVPKFGEVIEQRCELHLIGLKAALAHITAPAAVAVSA